MICAWTETSTADTGSSATMKAGLTDSALAIPIRCRCPPLKSRGWRSAWLATEPDEGEQREHAVVDLCARTDAMDGERLSEHLAHGHARVQRGIGVLKNHLEVAARLQHSRAREPQEVLAAEENLAARRLDKAQQRPSERRLAGTGFADEAEDLAAPDLQGDVVDSDQPTAASCA